MVIIANQTWAASALVMKQDASDFLVAVEMCVKYETKSSQTLTCFSSSMLKQRHGQQEGQHDIFTSMIKKKLLREIEKKKILLVM